MINFPLISINGYWDADKQLCIPLAAPPEKKADKPILQLAKTEVSSIPSAKSAEDNSGLANVLFVQSRITGCGTEAPSPMCESNPAPRILDNLLVDQKGERLKINPQAGDTITFKIKAVNCDNGTDRLVVEAALGSDNPQAMVLGSDGLFSFTFIVPVATPGLPLKLNFSVSDPDFEKRIDSQYDIWVQAPASSSASGGTKFEDISVQYDSDGAIPNRPITFSIGPSGTIDPAATYTYAWKVVDQSGDQAATGEGNSLNFTPEEEGPYNVNVTISQEGSTEKIIKSALITIFAFPKPEVYIVGPQAVGPGANAHYGVLIPGKELLPEYNPELTSCAWTVYHLDASLKPVEDTTKLDLCSKSIDFSFPTQVIAQTSYVIQVKVTHNDGLYEVGPLFLPVTLYPAATSTIPLPSAIIGSSLKYSYQVGDTVENIAGISDSAEVSYLWTVTRPGPDKDGKLIQTFEGSKIPSYTFDLSGDYAFKLEVTAKDGLTKNFDLRTVQVFPKAIPLPKVNLIGPFSGTKGDKLTYKIMNPEPNTTYKFFADGKEIETKDISKAETEGNLVFISFVYDCTQLGVHNLSIKAENTAGGKAETSPLPLYVSDVKQTDTKPISTVVIGPTPATYKVGSGLLASWSVYAENFDGSKDGIKAECIFDPAKPVTASSNNDGLITIETIFSQKIIPGLPYNGYLCKITGKNGEVRDPGAILYPPAFE